ncbi:hypothetical protein GCM10010176_005180 [Nonomuraea spiralis]|nr:hypothetical protein GCM10010176_005180 [Nonomuraea spiralis]
MLLLSQREWQDLYPKSAPPDRDSESTERQTPRQPTGESPHATPGTTETPAHHHTANPTAPTPAAARTPREFSRQPHKQRLAAPAPRPAEEGGGEARDPGYLT